MYLFPCACVILLSCACADMEPRSLKRKQYRRRFSLGRRGSTGSDESITASLLADDDVTIPRRRSASNGEMSVKKYHKLQKKKIKKAKKTKPDAVFDSPLYREPLEVAAGEIIPSPLAVHHDSPTSPRAQIIVLDDRLTSLETTTEARLYRAERRISELRQASVPPKERQGCHCIVL